MRAILFVTTMVAALAACDSPTAPHDFADGSVRMKDLNPQPLPPGLHLSSSSLNPQPLPPGLRLRTAAAQLGRSGQATVYTCTSGLYEPPDPCGKLSVTSRATGLVASGSLNAGRLSPWRKAGQTTVTCLASKEQPPDPCLQ